MRRAMPKTKAMVNEPAQLGNANDQNGGMKKNQVSIEENTAAQSPAPPPPQTAAPATAKRKARYGACTSAPANTKAKIAAGSVVVSAIPAEIHSWGQSTA